MYEIDFFSMNVSYVNLIIRPPREDRRAEGTFLLPDTTIWRKCVLVDYYRAAEN
jgi:hypothetical protein